MADGRQVVRAVAGAAVVAAGAATVLGYGERAYWRLGWLAGFPVQRAVALGTGSAVLAATGGGWPAVAGAAGLAVNLGLVAPFWTDRPQPPAGPERLRVASWNLQVGNQRTGEVLAALRVLDADVAFLLEAYGPWEEHLRDAGLPFTVRRPEGVPTGFLVLTRDPSAPLTVPLPEPRPIVEVALPLGGRRVRVLGVHTSAPVNAARARRRGDQLAFLADTVRASEDPVLVVGDLNVPPWAPEFRRLLADAELVDSMRGAGVQASWPAWPWARLARIPIDHALHTRELTTTARGLGPAAGSDHRLLTVTLAPSGAAARNGWP